MHIRYHIAQANIALGRAPLSDPVMKGFVDQLAYINSVADRSEGFVWRPQTEEGDASSIRVFDDPLIIINMSVWKSVEDLHAYVFRSDHLQPMRNRREWFRKMDRPHAVLWWIPAGEIPTVAEAQQRLDLLRELGPTADAFTFAALFDSAGKRVFRDSRMDQECGV